MDMLKLKSKFMLGIVESILAKELSKSLGSDVDISIGDIEATINDEGKLELNISNMKAVTDAKVIKKFMRL